MYDHPKFDYMAYNTLRMYDERLARPENAVDPLWERIAGVIPHYQRRFGIDGALIDMGHALPEELKAILIDRAHRIDEDFAFWDEAFEPSERARSEGYSAVMGNLWWTLQRPERMREHVKRIESRGVVIPSLATPETHNTPRSAAREGGRLRSRLTWVLGAFLPSLPFVHSGFELGEIRPINTGLDFSAEEIARHPTDRLGLYNAVAYDWAAAGEIVETIRRSLALRSRYAALVTDQSAETIWTLELPDERLVGYARMGELEAIVVIGLYGGPTRVAASPTVPLEDGAYIDALTGYRYRVEDGRTAVELEPWDVMLIHGRRPLVA